MAKIIVSTQLEPDVVAKLDAMIPDRADGPGAKSRSNALAWVVNRWAASVDTPKPRKIIARPPFSKEPTGLSMHAAAPSPEHEGARLKAAREAARLTQPQLAAAEHVSRNQIHRAERAASLEQWPALRSWLQSQEAKP